MADRIYAHEKLGSAVRGLATGREPIQRRVAAAFTHNLIHVDEDALPPGRAQRLREYRSAWNAVSDAEARGRINVWADRLNDDEAIEIADWIVQTEAELSYLIHAEELESSAS